MTLLTTLGWSTITFDGMMDSPFEPRTSSRTFHFGEADKHAVESLRQWAAGQTLANGPSVPLSSVQPRMFFDLTCQLLGKASLDTRCMLLKVWFMRLFITLYTMLNSHYVGVIWTVDSTLISYDVTVFFLN